MNLNTWQCLKDRDEKLLWNEKNSSAITVRGTDTHGTHIFNNMVVLILMK